MTVRDEHLVDGGPSQIRTRLLGYLALTKPRVIELLLVTTIPAMLLAHRGSVDPLLILNTLFGGLLAAAGANTLNCVADADIDKVMKRTSGQPLARRLFRVATPWCSAWCCRSPLSSGCGGPRTCYLRTWPRPPSRSMCSSTRCSSSAALRRTSSGAAPLGMPVMIGWSAVTGTVGRRWPCSRSSSSGRPRTRGLWQCATREDYEAAGVPMLPVVATPRQVTRQIVIGTWLTVFATLALIPAAGWLYASVAAWPESGSWRWPTNSMPRFAGAMR